MKPATIPLGETEADTEKPGHFCGIAGSWSPEPSNLGERLFYMLFSLQHRGQEAAGICWEREGTGELLIRKDVGMVSSVLSPFLKENNPSRVAIGHVRYSTAGGAGAHNAQPLVANCNKGRIALAHNGNISNSDQLRAELRDAGAIFQTTSDTELILHLMSRSRKTEPAEVIAEAFGRLEGAYSIVMAWNGLLYAIRDPKGFRPLYMARVGGSILVGSETCAVEFAGPAEARQIEPGEVACFGPEGERSFNLNALARAASFSRVPPDHESANGGEGARSHCVFELIYFARPDSEVFGRSVYETRLALGAALAEIDTVRGDVVVPVPDSGNIAAIGYARRAGLPFDFGLSRNHYTGRSFILPTKGQRELAVRMKLRPVAEVVEGKKVIMIDDSLVRGTTSGIIVRLLREAGAKEIHIRLSSPEIHWPCYYGIDIPTREELISNRLSPERIAAEIGADSVFFLPQEKLEGCLPNPRSYCYACFDGRYPCPLRAGQSGACRG